MKLALLNGKPIRTKPFAAHRTIGAAEKKAVCRVLDSGVLSKFLGCWHEDFYGGSEVRALESEWAAYFGAKHAVCVNSCTSGLYCAIGASGVGPGDEVIVSPYTMSASATAPLIFGAVPVFADIEPDCFCLDPKAVEARITSRTRAIVVVDIFGLPYDAKAINALARKHGLLVIEDTAQAPGAKWGSRYAGTLGHLGVYSLNYHKHIHCGEGGVVVTDDDKLADRVRLIRNHAEAVVEAKAEPDLTNMIGFNFRMTEVEAAISRCQLRKLEKLLSARQANADTVSRGLKEIPAITPPVVRKGCTHSYYVQACKFDEEVAGVPRDRFIAAVRAELPPFELREKEGVKLSCGYVKPLYLQPLFQKRIAHGSKGYPFKAPVYTGSVDYRKGLCPVVERMHEKEVFVHELMQPQMTRRDLDDVVKAFHKVWDHRSELR